MPTASEVVSRRCGQRSYNDDIKRSAVYSRILIMTAALIMTSITIWGCTGREVVQNRLHSGGGGMIHAAQGGPPFFPFEGRLHSGGGWAAHHLTLSAAHPPLTASATLSADQIP